MAERDPRNDPRPGDVLRTKSGEAYRVVLVDRTEVVDTPVDDNHCDFGEELSNGLGAWRWFMSGAEVIHRGE